MEMDQGGCCQGSWVPTFGGEPGVSGAVDAFTVFDDGTGPALCAGGSFTTAGGVAANDVARWDGSAWSPLGSGVEDGVLALTAFDDGFGPALYAGGRITLSPAGDSFLGKWGCRAKVRRN